MSVLDIRNLNVAFETDSGDLHALRDVSFTVPKKKIVGVVGESGCGKSTLINTILGLLAQNGRVDGGKVIFNKQDLLRLGQAEMRQIRGLKISTVFQDPMGALNPVISVGKQMEHIQYRSPQNRADKKQRSVEMLRRVRIPDPEAALGRYPHEFSGGMKQRIAIAMALMMEPDLLIADEPTTALDATLEVATIELLKDLQEQIGCSVLFISHHLGVIAELCDDVVVMYAGEVVERGTTRQIFHTPLHPYTQKLLECDPARQADDNKAMPTIPGEIPDLHEAHEGCIFAPRCHERESICKKTPPEIARKKHIARCHKVTPC
ncbi:MAG: ABC transporter ATP-binding protein [Parvularculales bacterium]